MVNTDGSPEEGLDTLKKRQRRQRDDRRKQRTPPPHEDPITLTAAELARPISGGDGLPASLAAATITPAIVSGPFAADNLAGYVIAEQDAIESVVPRGCTTEVSRVLWHKGDRVRRDVHEAYWAGVETAAAKAESA